MWRTLREGLLILFSIVAGAAVLMVALPSPLLEYGLLVGIAGLVALLWWTSSGPSNPPKIGREDALAIAQRVVDEKGWSSEGLVRTATLMHGETPVWLVRWLRAEPEFGAAPRRVEIDGHSGAVLDIQNFRGR